MRIKFLLIFNYPPPYTIGAIRSLAFKQKTIPVVDGNVIRVLCRYFMIEDDISKLKTVKKIWEIAESLSTILGRKSKKALARDHLTTLKKENLLQIIPKQTQESGLCQGVALNLSQPKAALKAAQRRIC